MLRAFVDTSAWYEAMVAKAGRHAETARWLAGFAGRLTTSTDVVHETVALLKIRHGHAVAVAFGDYAFASGAVHLVAVEETFREEAWRLFKARDDKGYSLTDCTSFVIMRRLNIEVAATTDDHFRQEGFRVVPD